MDYLVSTQVSTYKSKILYFMWYETISGIAALWITAESRFAVRYPETVPPRVYIGDNALLAVDLDIPKCISS